MRESLASVFIRGRFTTNDLPQKDFQYTTSIAEISTLIVKTFKFGFF